MFSASVFSPSNVKKVFLHAGIWICFIAYEIAIAKDMHIKAPLYQFACFYTLDFWLFYFNAYAASPFAARKKYSGIAIAIVLALELGTYASLSIGMDIAVHTFANRRLTVEIDMHDWIISIWRGIYFLALSTGYYLGLRSLANARKATLMLQQKIEAERREATLENAHLRAQINPHLLFNTLNFIYSSVESVSASASESIVLLADSMRYAMMPTHEDGKIELYKEIEQIERYIQLNQLRFKNKLGIHMDVSPESYEEHLRIPPLLLLTFVENIFKHGNLLEGSAVIKLHLQGNNLHFHTENLKANRKGNEGEHIGLTNVRSRLQKHYDNNFDLELDNNGSNFIINLNFRL